MKPSESALNRLLKSAATTVEHEHVAPPFGFETRVVALWRAGAGNGTNGLARLLRRVAVLAGIVILVSSAASVSELRKTVAISESGADDYAMADSAIEQEFDQ